MWNLYQKNLRSLLLKPIGEAIRQPLIEEFKTDSRNLQAGDFFVPLKGENFDGHDFITQACKTPITGFFCHPDYYEKLDPKLKKQAVVVQDTLQAFQQVCLSWRQSLKKTLITSHTGSNGKTTVKNLLATIFQNTGPTTPIVGNYNNEIGVPISIQKIREDHQFAALEFGARHTGNIQELLNISEPNICCVINVGIAHLGEFQTQEHIYQTKTEIFAASPGKTHNIVLRDDEHLYSLALAKTGSTPLWTFGFHKEADLRILEVSSKQNTMTLKYQFQNQPHFEVELNCYHECLPINVAAAACMALAAGVKTQDIQSALKLYQSAPGRFQVHNKKELCIIDDAYNANPDSMKAGLRSMKALFANESKTLVLGDMGELGPEEEAMHREIGEFCATTIQPSCLITVGNLAQEIRKGFLKHDSATKTLHFDSTDALIAAQLNFTELSDAIYIKASNSMGFSKLVHKLLKEY